MADPMEGGIYGKRAMWGPRIQFLMIHFILLNAPNMSPYFASDKFFPQNGAKHSIPESTLSGWLNHYLWWGESPAQTRKNKRYKRNGKSKMQPKHLAFLKDLVMNESHLYLDEIRDRLHGKFNKYWSTSCIHKSITVHLNFSLQQIQMRAIQASEMERMVYRGLLSDYDDPAMFVFVDETCVGRNAARRRRHWAPRGGPAPFGWEWFMDENDDGQVYTMIGAADINGFIVDACQPVWRKSGESDRNVMRGTVTAKYFEDWIVHSLIPKLGRVELNQPRSVVIMDNATVHNPERVEKLLKEAGAAVVWTAAYSPDLNPIERCFHQYKSDLKRYRMIYNDPLDRHMHALYSVSKNNMVNYYRGKALEGCIRNLPDVALGKRDFEVASLIAMGIIGVGSKRVRIE
jgi:hypothetical protein